MEPAPVAPLTAAARLVRLAVSELAPVPAPTRTELAAELALMAFTKVYCVAPTVIVSPATAGPPTETKAEPPVKLVEAKLPMPVPVLFAVKVAVVPVVALTWADVLVGVPDRKSTRLN